MGSGAVCAWCFNPLFAGLTLKELKAEEERLAKARFNPLFAGLTLKAEGRLSSCHLWQVSIPYLRG